MHEMAGHRNLVKFGNLGDRLVFVLRMKGTGQFLPIANANFMASRSMACISSKRNTKT